MKNTLASTFIFLVVFIIASCSLYAEDFLDTQPTNYPGKFALGMCVDKKNNLWCVDEDMGIFCYRNSQWDVMTKEVLAQKHNLTIQDNSFYAVECDNDGRIWVGTLRDGVLVYNGETWKKISMDEGLPTDRIFCIKVQQSTGSIWLGTSNGVLRYHPKTQKWRLWNRLDGLPSEQIYALTFDDKDNLYLGTDCEGIVLASPKDDYTRLTSITTPKKFEEPWRIPLVPEGDGIPSNQINTLYTATNGDVYAGTASGLTWTKDNGKTWMFVRGKNWENKIKKLLIGANSPPRYKPLSKEKNNELLPEDYVCMVGEDVQNRLWVGTREKGIAEFNPKTQRISQSYSLDYPVAMCNYANATWVGTRGKGVFRSKTKPKSKPPRHVKKQSAKYPRMPVDYPPPTENEMLKLHQKAIHYLKTKKTGQPWSAFMNQDWSTQGDWTGRYGKCLFFCCGTSNGYCMVLPTHPEYSVWVQQGANAHKDDAARNWLHWSHTQNPRSLTVPDQGIRVQAEWDDHGEAYSRDAAGPGLWLTFHKFPKGKTFRVSLYFFNKDGEIGANRYRDFMIRFIKGKRNYKKTELTIDEFFDEKIFNAWEKTDAGRYSGRASTPDLVEGAFLPPVAQTRVKDFRGGVWVTFVFSGGFDWYLQLDRNYSFNTMVCGLGIDELDGSSILPEPWQYPLFDRSIKSRVHAYACEMPQLPQNVSDSTSQKILDWNTTSLNALSSPQGVVLRKHFRFLLSQYAQHTAADTKLQKHFRWAASIWSQKEHAAFAQKMRIFWARLQKEDPLYYCDRERFPYSPDLRNIRDKEYEEEMERHIMKNPWCGCWDCGKIRYEANKKLKEKGTKEGQFQ